MSIAVQIAPWSRASWIINAEELLDFAIDKEIAVDLSNTDRVSSEDLNELIRLQLLAKQAGKCFVLENVSETVEEVFKLTRLDRLIELRSDEAHSPIVPGHHLK